MTMPVAVEDLRRLIVDAAPDAALAAPVLSCDDTTLLDSVIPFTSMIVLGVVVAVEDRFAIRVTKQMLARAFADGITLRSLAAMIENAQAPEAR
jgi:hypothetical protein